MTSVFISYSREDFDDIGRLLTQLDAMSLPYWIDGKDHVPSMEFHAGSRSGLQQSPWYMVAMTPRSAVSDYVKDELHWALTNRNGRVIPVMLEECEPTEFHLRLQRIPIVDLTPQNKKGQAQLQQTLLAVQNDEPALPLNGRRIDSELEMISLLLSSISRNHQKHLRNLLPKSGADLANYMGCGSLREELRDLCAWGLLKPKTKVRVADHTQDRQRFNLKDVVALTDLGKRVAAHVS